MRRRQFLGLLGGHSDVAALGAGAAGEQAADDRPSRHRDVRKRGTIARRLLSIA